MSFKITIFCWQQTASDFRKRHYGNWCCVFETILCSARNAVCVCMCTTCSLPLSDSLLITHPTPHLCTCGYILLGLRVQFPPEACMSLLICHVGVSASVWSLVRRNPTECAVFECDREASIVRRLWPTRGSRTIKKMYSRNNTILQKHVAQGCSDPVSGILGSVPEYGDWSGRVGFVV
jgi:hypothetical protein